MPERFVIAKCDLWHLRQSLSVMASGRAKDRFLRQASAFRGVRIEPIQAGHTLVRPPGPIRFKGMLCTLQRGCETATMRWV